MKNTLTQGSPRNKQIDDRRRGTSRTRSEEGEYRCVFKRRASPSDGMDRLRGRADCFASSPTILLASLLLGALAFLVACDGGSKAPTIPAQVTCSCFCEPVVCEGGQTVTRQREQDQQPVGVTSSEPRENVTLVLWHSYRGDEERALDQVVELFNATHPDTTIETLAIPFDAYPDRITAAVPRGRGPDFFIFAHDRIGDWADQGVIEPVNYWVTPQILEQYYDVTVEALVYRRRIFGLPLAFKSVVLFYNTDHIQQPPTTTDELIALPQSLTDTTGQQSRYGLVYENTKLYFHAPWIHGFGGVVIDAEGNLTVDSEANQNALRFAVALRQEHNLLPDNVYTQMINTFFSNGQASMVISGPWFRGEIASDLPWAVAPLPTITETGLPARPFLTSEAVLLSAMSQNKDRAFEAALWLTSNLDAARIRMDVGHQPVSVRAAYQDEETLDPAIRIFRDQMENSVPTPNLPLMLRTWGHMDTALFNAIRNQAEVAQVLRTARERIESEMQ